MAISRETARRRTNLALISAGLLGVCAVGEAIVRIPNPEAADAAQPSDTPPKPTEASAEPEKSGSYDVVGLSSTLDALGVARKETLAEAPPASHDPGTQPSETAKTTITATGEWKYLGSIVGPRATHAMISIDGKQQLLAPGTEINSIRLMAVTATELLVEDHGQPKTIKLAERKSDWPDANSGRSGPRPAPIAGGVTPSPVPPAPSMEEAERAERMMAEKLRAEEDMRRQREQQGLNQPPGTPMRPSPLPTDAAPGGPKRPVPIKGVGGAGSRS